MTKHNFTEEEKKILKSGIGTILWKIVFWPAALFEILVAVITLSDYGKYGVGFWLFTIPFFGIFYMAFRKQWFWKEDRQREYISKVIAKRGQRLTVPNVRQSNEGNYKATSYAPIKNEETIGRPIEDIKEEVVVKAVSQSISQEVDVEIPPLQGDYAKTVFLWAFRKPNSLKQNNEYAAYFLYECGIRDCVSYHKKLISEGYFAEATPAEKLEALKIPELKAMLEELDKPVSGKKIELINRIIESAEADFLESHCREKLYVLSTVGEQFLEKHKAYAEIHKHNWDITWKEYDLYAKPGEEYLNVVWRIINDRLKRARLQEQRNLYLELYQILREKGNKSDALEMLLKVFFLDFSGIEGQSCYDLYHSGIYDKKRLKESFPICILMAPGNIESLSEFKNFYDEEMIDQLYTWNLPMNICSKELFKKIIESGVNSSFDEETTTKELTRAFNHMVDEL